MRLDFLSTKQFAEDVLWVESSGASHSPKMQNAALVLSNINKRELLLIEAFCRGYDPLTTIVMFAQQIQRSMQSCENSHCHHHGIN